MYKYSGKTVVVTGASSGIGEEIARRFYLAGANVAMCSRSIERINAAAENFAPAGDQRILAVAADTQNVAAIRRLCKSAADRYGGVDIWINNAGIEKRTPAEKIEEEEFDAIIATNLKGYFFGCQAAARDMLARGAGGVIINITSVQAVTTVLGMSHYASTKAAVTQLTKNLAREWARSGIRVNSIGPGSIPTEINREVYKDPAVEKDMCNRIPMGRRGDTAYIADAALFLASDSASYITGQTLFVDGGVSVVLGC